MENQISIDVQRMLTEQKLALWRNTLYDAQLDTEIAKVLEDEQLKAQAMQRIKQAMKAIDLLEKKLEEMPKEIEQKHE